MQLGLKVDEFQILRCHGRYANAVINKISKIVTMWNTFYKACDYGSSSMPCSCGCFSYTGTNLSTILNTTRKSWSEACIITMYMYSM